GWPTSDRSTPTKVSTRAGRRCRRFPGASRPNAAPRRSKRPVTPTTFKLTTLKLTTLRRRTSGRPEAPDLAQQDPLPAVPVEGEGADARDVPARPRGPSSHRLPDLRPLQRPTGSRRLTWRDARRG